MKARLVVVGNGMAGMRTVEEVLKLAPDLYDITVFGAEPHGNYNRVLLSPLLAGDKNVDEIMLHPRAWYARRLRDVHDIWHVLTGYHSDALGEACVVAFSLPQTRSAGFGLIAGGIAVQFMRARTGYPCARAVLQAWRNGRRAAWLPGEDYEKLLAEPLDQARRRLKIPAPTLYDQVPPSVRNAYQGGKG